MYGKIFDSVFTGSMYGSGPVVFSVWAYVIANAEPPGVVELNARRMADCIGCSVQDIEAALAHLCQPDPNSRNAEEEGRRLIHLRGMQYRVVSFQKYRDMRDAEHRRAYMRNLMREKRGSVSTLLAPVSTPLAMLAKAEEEAEEEAEAKKSRARGSRFALTQLPDEWALFASKERPDLDPKALFAKFSDYWTAVPGAKGRKVDWGATWRNFVRSERAVPAWAKPPQSPEQKAAELMRLAEERGH